MSRCTRAYVRRQAIRKDKEMCSIAYFSVGFIVFFPIGLYFGKRRAEGKGWFKITREFVSDVKECIMSAWRKLSWLFRNGGVNSNVDA